MSIYIFFEYMLTQNESRLIIVYDQLLPLPSLMESLCGVHDYTIWCRVDDLGHVPVPFHTSKSLLIRSSTYYKTHLTASPLADGIVAGNVTSYGTTQHEHKSSNIAYSVMPKIIYILTTLDLLRYDNTRAFKRLTDPTLDEVESIVWSLVHNDFHEVFNTVDAYGFIDVRNILIRCAINGIHFDHSRKYIEAKIGYDLLARIATLVPVGVADDTIAAYFLNRDIEAHWFNYRSFLELMRNGQLRETSLRVIWRAFTYGGLIPYGFFHNIKTADDLSAIASAKIQTKQLPELTQFLTTLGEILSQQKYKKHVTDAQLDHYQAIVKKLNPDGYTIIEKPKVVGSWEHYGDLN
jgi:hypothetical protein